MDIPGFDKLICIQLLTGTSISQKFQLPELQVHLMPDRNIVVALLFHSLAHQDKQFNAQQKYQPDEPDR
jgi:hypothetical protein